MGAGGASKQMKEIRAKIAELSAYYEQQRVLYEQIRSVGAQERELIEQGLLDQLLVVLQEKESLLREASMEESQIKASQELLACHFGLAEFSIPKLKVAAPKRYEQDFIRLEEVVAQLVPALEGLEEQERTNEALLSLYLEQVKNPKQDPARQKRATKAYKSQQE